MAEDPEKEETIEDSEEIDETPQENLSEHIPEIQKAVKEMLDSDKEALRNAKIPPNLHTALAKKESPEEVYHTIKFMEDVPMRVYAEVARTEIPLRHILSWKTGSIVKFDKIIGEPIEVLIGEQLIARGEVVVVNNRFGVRISEITRPDEKIGDFRQ